MNLRTADLGRDDGLITSLDNPTIRFARNLQRRRVRYRERAVLVEGTRTIRTASEHGARIRALLIDARHVDTVDPILLEALVGTSERVLLVAGEPFDSVVDTAHPQPLAAICAMPDAILPSEATLVLALDGVRDPGNLGTLTRTAAAAGADAVALLPGCVDQFHPRTVRASAGTVFALPIVPVADVSAIVQQSFCTKPLVVLADAAGDCTWDAVDWSQPCVIVLGGEATGASEKSRTYADLRVLIPMALDIESLNVAAAGAALLFECVRQRRTQG